MERTRLLCTWFDNVTTPEVLAHIGELIPLRQAEAVVELNVDVVMKIEKDPLLQRVVEQSALSLIDGKPLMWISRWKGIPVREKISGSDLVPQVCALAEQKGWSVFLLGGREEVNRTAAQKLRERHPALRLENYSPPLGFEKNEAENQKLLTLLRQSDPDILLLCLGCPKQETWWLQNRAALSAGVCLCAGATVDFLAGNVKRAPPLGQRSRF